MSTYQGISLKPGQSEALSGLYAAIAGAEDTNPRSVPCVGPERALWTSQRPTDQAKAATRCQRCPVLTQCGNYETEFKESGAVWGGRRRGYQQTEIDLEGTNQ